MLAVAALAAAALGAWVDWRFWHPTQGVQILVIAAALLALALATVLRRRLPGLLAVVTAAVVGLAAGIVLGPSREELRGSQGTVEVRLDRPTSVTDTMSAHCSTSASGEQVAISAGDSGDTIRIGPDHELSLSLDRGDMYEFGVGERPDHLGLLVLVRRTTAVDTETGPSETRLGSDATSRLETTGTALDGTLTFDGLVRDPASEADEAIDLAGTISWSCETPIGRPAGASPGP